MLLVHTLTQTVKPLSSVPHNIHPVMYNIRKCVYLVFDVHNIHSRCAVRLRCSRETAPGSLTLTAAALEWHCQQDGQGKVAQEHGDAVYAVTCDHERHS